MWITFSYIAVWQWDYGGMFLSGLALHEWCQKGEKINVQLEEREEKEKTKGMECGDTCINVGWLERGIKSSWRCRVEFSPVKE